jgi:hypothetical protein
MLSTAVASGWRESHAVSRIGRGLSMYVYGTKRKERV